MNIIPLLNLPVSVLSAGQKRRCAMARLLIEPRALWVLDEPTAALDTASTLLVEQACFTHLEQGGAIIAATHLPFLDMGQGTKTIELKPYFESDKDEA